MMLTAHFISHSDAACGVAPAASPPRPLRGRLLLSLPISARRLLLRQSMRIIDARAD